MNAIQKQAEEDFRYYNSLVRFSQRVLEDSAKVLANLNLEYTAKKAPYVRDYDEAERNIKLYTSKAQIARKVMNGEKSIKKNKNHGKIKL